MVWMANALSRNFITILSFKTRRLTDRIWRQREINKADYSWSLSFLFAWAGKTSADLLHLRSSNHLGEYDPRRMPDLLNCIVADVTISFNCKWWLSADYKNQRIAKDPSLPTEKSLKIINVNSTVPSCLPFLFGPCIFPFSLYFALTASQIIYQTRATMFYYIYRKCDKRYF